MSLHVHSEYSSLDGWSTVDEIGDRMLEIGCPFCGLTDHGVVAGHIAFDQAMRSRGINPVFGAELYHGVKFDGSMKKNERDQHHLLALAMTDEGLRNLWRLVNATSDREHFHHVGRVTNDDIVKYSEGIHFTSACPLGLVPQGLLKGDTKMLNWYRDNLGDQFSIEITTYPGDAEWDDMDSEDSELVITPQVINEMLVEVAEERGIMITYGDDGHYARPDQYPEHDMYLAAQTRQSIYTPLEERKMWHPEGALCIKDELTVRKALAYLPESVVDSAINNTHRLGETADAHLPTVDRPHMPVFVPADCPWAVNPDTDPTVMFISLVEQGIADRYPEGSPNEAAAWEKAAHEIEVLTEDGLEHYFLMGWDVVQFCKLEGINIGPGRGSSAGSIVAYALGITDVDPLHYDLYFERFWNKGRTEGFPDIDTDFSKARRDEIHDYLIARYGEDKVCSIGTITRMKPLSVIEKLATACEIDHGAMEGLKKIVRETPDLEIHGVEQIGWNPELEPGKTIYVKEAVGDQIEEWVGKDEKRRRFIEMCEHTCSRNSNYGIHASGIVVSDIDLADYAPAYRRGGKEGVPATLFPMNIIDALKLIKLDVLGLKTLDTLAEWDKLMQEKGETTEWSRLDREEMPDDMWELMSEGFVAGIFQCETHAGKDLAERLKPTSIEDLGVLVALNRPGPSRAGVPNKYIARKEGRSKVAYAHPILEPILSNSYGLFVYQEQVIRYFGALGYSLGEGDAVRKILGKKHPEKLADLREGKGEWKGKGYFTMTEAAGIKRDVAEGIWKAIEGFADYSFNKSHAIAYGIIAFRCLYAKYRGPQEYYIACIRTVDKTKRGELTPEYIKEARRAGIKVLPPDINYSKAEVDVHDGNIYFGFGDIKGVGTGGAYLVYLRDELGFDVSTPEALEDALNEFNDQQLAMKKARADDGDPLPADWKSPKQQLNDKKLALVHAVGAWDATEGAIDLKDKQRYEEEYLSVVLTDDTDDIIENHIEEIAECDDWAEAMTPFEDKAGQYDWTDEDGEDVPDTQRHLDYRLPGIITNVKRTKVKASGKAMGIITWEYGRHEMKFACFSDKWPNNSALFKNHRVGIFTVRHVPSTSNRGEGYHFRSGRILK